MHFIIFIFEAKLQNSICLTTPNADVVGAINVLRAGHARLACEVNPDIVDQRREPAEVIQQGSNASA